MKIYTYNVKLKVKNKKITEEPIEDKGIFLSESHEFDEKELINTTVRVGEHNQSEYKMCMGMGDGDYTIKKQIIR